MQEISAANERAARLIWWRFFFLMAAPAVIFAVWFLASEMHKSLADGDYTCLDAESQRRKELSAQQGVPMLHDPRPGKQWVATLADGALVEAFYVQIVDFNKGKVETTQARAFSLNEVMDDDQFSATIDGESFTCTY